MLNYKHEGSGWLCPAWLWATQTTVTHHLFTGGFQLKHLAPRQRRGLYIFHAAEALNLKPWGCLGFMQYFHLTFKDPLHACSMWKYPIWLLFFPLYKPGNSVFLLRQTHVRYTSQSELTGIFFFQEISVLNIALHTSPLSRPPNFWPRLSNIHYYRYIWIYEWKKHIFFKLVDPSKNKRCLLYIIYKYKQMWNTHMNSNGVIEAGEGRWLLFFDASWNPQLSPGNPAAKVMRHNDEVSLLPRSHTSTSPPSAFPPCSWTSVDLALQSSSFCAWSHTLELC